MCTDAQQYGLQHNTEHHHGKSNISIRYTPTCISSLYYPHTVCICIDVFQNFQLSVLQACIALGVEQTRHLPGNHMKKSSTQQSSDVDCEGQKSRDVTFSPLFQASQLALFRHISTIITQLPAPHTTVKQRTEGKVMYWRVVLEGCIKEKL